ncbi:protein kinase [Mycolicibacterium fluoranthenivorans]|uniref:Serine/threonine-protein kinase PknK n=1 Tax=Mycolicibacterium fluoranthenivorans TaxID=258505 RepID=A0A1G4WX81_9MYCO|nr:serine/threonine-protein kinase [Mycolicibacterium fluoranthenivorans]QNJ94811.1 protein kinase [Mycolicibacterium fluoranthenivorans]SCX31408.1 serine/threonine-protein kinase PknK [Mycolicibacterium fluoranthenivorans]
MTDYPWATQRETDITAELSDAGFDDPVEIGRGGFGTVFRCRQEDLDRTVALKVLTSDFEPDSLARFLREQRAMGRMSGHPHIVDLYQVGVTRSGRPFLVMPYHAHGSLHAFIRRGGPLRWERVLQLGVKIAGALATAHHDGTLHRDVKPANILLTDFDEPQLTDFGIARITGGFETAAGAITGSPAFTAPEVLQGHPSTAASDVYSLGATMFVALTGHAAFERRSGERLVAQFLRISTEPLPDLHVAGIPDDVGGAVEHAMARPPESRPTSAAAFGQELRAIQRAHGLVVDDMLAPMSQQREGPESPDSHERGRLDVVSSRTPPVPVTKFRPPTSSRQMVRRQRLLDALREGGESRLTLVHGPAGFGKSSLLAQWREELMADHLAVAWLTVDSDDNNAVGFLSHLTAAVRRVRAPVVDGLGEALEENGSAVAHFVLVSLINRVHDSGEPLVVVIDDWHRVSAKDSIEAMEFLLDNSCHHLRMVVASRTKGGLPLSRMRVCDELLEIDTKALSFDLDESRSFFADRVRTQLTDADIALLRDSTDGWIAALQLASLSLREAGGTSAVLERFRADASSVEEYLAENVLNALEPEMLDFLLTTSVPERVCGELASVLAEVADGQARLEEVAARDLFLVRATDEHRWYRYHHLFAQILRRRLERDHPGRTKQLHHSASAWFREQRLLGDAIDHLLAAGDPASAVALVEEDDLYLLDRSQMSTLLGLISKLPADLVFASARLQLDIGWANTELQRLDEAAEARRRSLDVLDVLGPPADQVRRLRVESDVLQAAIYCTADRVLGVKDLVAECLAEPAPHSAFLVSMAAILDTFADTYEFRFGDAERRQRWAAPYHSKTTGPYTVAYAYCFAGSAKAEQLDLDGAIELYRRAYQLVREAGNTQSHHARLTRAFLAEQLYLRNQVDEAEELLAENFYAASLGGTADFMMRHYCIRARIASIHGDRTGTLRELDEGAHTADLLSLPRLQAAVDNERVRLGMPLRPGFAPVSHTRKQNSADGIGQITAQLEDETAITLLLRTDDPEQIHTAVGWASDWTRSLEGTDRALAWLYAGRLLVSCLWAAGNADEAEAALIPVATRCAQHGLIRFLPDGGANVIAALTSLSTHVNRADDRELRRHLPDTFIDNVLAATS